MVRSRGGATGARAPAGPETGDPRAGTMRGGSACSEVGEDHVHGRGGRWGRRRSACRCRDPGTRGRRFCGYLAATVCCYGVGARHHLPAMREIDDSVQDAEQTRRFCSIPSGTMVPITRARRAIDTAHQQLIQLGMLFSPRLLPIYKAAARAKRRCALCWPNDASVRPAVTPGISPAGERRILDDKICLGPIRGRSPQGRRSPK